MKNLLLCALIMPALAGQPDQPCNPHRSGMNYTVNDDLILDFGVQAGLNSEAEDFGFFAGFTKRF